MSIETFGALGEMIGALAVLVSLIYLAKQIKHSSEVAKISSYHEGIVQICLLYTSPSPRDQRGSGMASSAW